MKSSSAFTVIELIFVIVVLGILSAVALPKFAGTGTQARIASGKADVSAIRSGILSERQKRLIKGDSTYISPTSLNTADGLFAGVLAYPKKDSSNAGQWNKTAQDENSTTYNYNVDGTNVQFTYSKSSGTFTCNPGTETTDAQKYCARMIY
jgi:general secretion pathway protein G